MKNSGKLNLSSQEEQNILEQAAKILFDNPRKADEIAKNIPSTELAEVTKRFQQELDRAT